jgi:threonine synthase
VGAAIGLNDLWLKDEGVLPTGTFKSRGAAVGISRAKELGIKAVAMPTNGNAGGAWATYGARAGIEVALCMPTDAPAMSVLECTAVGARAWMVKGLISDAGAIIAKAAKKYGWFEAATLKEPYRIEGKKTMGYEIAEQFNWELPDAILYPTGGGVGIIGIYKALLEMQALGWISGPLPKLICVQPAGCAPIVKAFHEGKEVSEFWQNAATLQQGTRVPKALGDFLVLQAVRATGGTAIAVEDDDAIWGLNQLAQQEGAFICPEGAALVAAARDLRKSGFLKETDRVVLLNTGAGIKYPDILRPNLPVVEIGAEI